MIKNLAILYLVTLVESKVCDKNFDLDIDENDLINKEYRDVVLFDDIDFIQNRSLAESGCKCKQKKCIRKCCPEGYGYYKKEKVCIPIEEAFDPPLWNSYYQVDMNISAVNVVYGCVNCVAKVNQTRVLVGKFSDRSVDYHLRLDGKLYIETPHTIPPWILKTPDEYCVDTFILTDENGNNVTKFDALVCFSADVEENSYVFTSTCMLISCVFILATLAVYAWVPELRNLHGRVLMAYLSSLLVAFAILAFMQVSLLYDYLKPFSCAMLTIFIYYFLLSAFFWLNTMCFDIWWTFSGKRGLSLEKLSIRGRFYAYAAYAYGFPLMLTIILTALEFSGLPPRPWMPLLRMEGCFLAGYAKLIYMYGPILILCIANLVFFILTAIKIAKVNHQTSMLKSRDSQTHDPHRNDKQRLLLYVKLFTVMGINWFLEVISGMYPESDKFWWKVTDAYNVLIGVIIFIIFVCKRKTLALIKKRFKQRRGESMSRTQTSSSRLSNRDDLQMDKVNGK